MCTGAEPAAAADVGSTLCASSAAAAGTDTLATAGTDALATAGTDTLATAGTDALASGAPGALSLGGSTIAQNAGLASAGLEGGAGAATAGSSALGYGLGGTAGYIVPSAGAFDAGTAAALAAGADPAVIGANADLGIFPSGGAPAYSGPGTTGAGAAADSAAAAPTFGQQLGTAAQYLGEANSAVNFAQNPNLQNAASLGLNTYGLSSSGTAGLSSDGTTSAVSAPGAGAGAGGGAGLGSGGDGFQSVVPSTSDAASAAAQQTGSSAPSFLPDAAQAPLPTDSALNTVTPPPTPGFVDKALGALGNMSGHDWINAGNLALGTTALVKQSQGLGSAQRQLNAAAAPAQGVEKQLLNQFQTGQLTGADAQAIAQWTQQQTAQVNQYYEQAGLSNSSMHQAALTQVSQQADQMRQQALNNMLSNGLSAAGVANPLISTGVTAGVQQDANAMQAMQNFLNTLANMNTQGKTPAPTPTPTGSPGG